MAIKNSNCDSFNFLNIFGRKKFLNAKVKRNTQFTHIALIIKKT